MKTALVIVAGISGINYGLPASLSELATIIDPTNKERAEAIILNSATEYFKQQNLINVRNKIAEELGKKFKTQPKLSIGKVEVTAVIENEKITGYVSLDGKKKFKADETVTKESAKEFIDRMVSEQSLTEDAIRKIVQKVADANPFSASQKRVRGSVASKPVGKKWTSLAEKIIKAGNGEAAALKLSKELGEAVDVSGADAVKRLALALSEKARKAREAEEAEAEGMAGTAENPLVLDGTK